MNINFNMTFFVSFFERGLRIFRKYVIIVNKIKGCFQNCKNLKSVTFESGSTLKHVMEWGFAGCSSLESITLPASLKSIGDMMFENAEKLAKEKGYKNLRIDTHRDNKVMQKLIARKGFTYCGVVVMENGDDRLRNGYQKIL